MTRVNAKLREAHAAYWHYCPGCDQIHALPLEGWTYNGNEASPTFTPSFKHNRGNGSICHYILTGGILQFQTDSTHKLSGQTVALPDLPDAEAEKWGL